MEQLDSKREKIIEAARVRFSHYGYPKTTIAELANDCAMSAGNIYRFFQGKIDIATEIARRESLAAIARIEFLMNCPLRSARQRLEEMLFLDLQTTFHTLENNPKVIELAQIVASERPLFQIEGLRREKRAIARLVRHGIKTKEFAYGSASEIAACIQNATMKYRFAPIFTTQTLEQLELELAGVLTLIMRGLLSERARIGFQPTKVPAETAIKAKIATLHKEPLAE